VEFIALVRAGVADVAGFRTHDLPLTLRSAHIDVRIAVVAGDLAARRTALNGGQRG